MIYGYARVSTTHQKIARQITNITAVYPNATIIKEFFTGTTQNRPHWEKCIPKVKKEDTIVFDSVSRMARNSADRQQSRRYLILRQHNTRSLLRFYKLPITGI